MAGLCKAQNTDRERAEFVKNCFDLRLFAIESKLDLCLGALSTLPEIRSKLDECGSLCRYEIPAGCC